MKTIDCLAVDPGLSNTGLARLRIDVDTGDIEIAGLRLISSAPESKAKGVRVNSDDLRRAEISASAIIEEMKDCHLLFAEIPSGAQNARAATAFGICTGILGTIRAMGRPIIEVMPSERGMAILGKKSVCKEEVIDFMTKRYPDAPWLRARNNPTGKFIDKNEHIADAVAIGWAGVKTPQFKQALGLVRAMHIAK